MVLPISMMCDIKLFEIIFEITLFSISGDNLKKCFNSSTISSQIPIFKGNILCKDRKNSTTKQSVPTKKNIIIRLTHSSLRSESKKQYHKPLTY